MSVPTDLGIPPDYGTRPALPRFGEAPVLEDAGPNVVGRPQRLAPDTARAWRSMRIAAAADTVELLLVSGFRSIAEQAAVIRRKLEAGHAIVEILRVNAAPGFSEHHSGHAVDIATPGARPLTEEFESTEAFAWLMRHAAEFGFSLSYPRDNMLGFAYEPWHWSRLAASRT